MSWRHIEDAPVNQPVLVLMHDRPWPYNEQIRVGILRNGTWWDYNSDAFDPSELCARATHWMPLPSPPAVGE